MAIPSNYIDKITKEGDSRMICPAADKVRVDNENFEADNLDDVLDEVAEAIEDAGGGYNPPAGGIPKTDLAPGVQASLDKADNAVQKVSGKGLSTNDYTTEDKTKLAGLPTNPVTSISVNGQTAQTPTNGNVNLVIEAGAQGQKGDKGDTVVIGDEEEFLIVNDLVTGGESDALSAEMGRRLAMLSGTFAAAWAHAQAIPYVFPWLWVETVDGDAICKPIWHKGNSSFIDAFGEEVNVDAASVPAAPTITFSTTPVNNEVPKNTTATISCVSDAVLYYKVDNNSWIASDKSVTLTLSTAGSTTIQAYTANNKGNSVTTASVTVTVQGTAVPTIEAKSGSTMTGTSPNFTVNRGGYVTISADGDLTYTTDGSDPTSSGTAITVSGPNASADVQITGSMTIKAFNTENEDDSDVQTWSLSMAALTPPTMTMSASTDTPNEFPAGGGTVSLSHTDNNVSIYYTTDGTTTPSGTASPVVGTLYSGTPISVTSTTTIKAVAHDTWGDSEVESKTFTVVENSFIIDTSDQSSTVTIGGVTFNLDSTTASPVSGYRNKITQSQLTAAGASITDNKTTLSFSDKSKIKLFDSGAFIITSTSSLFNNATNMTKCTVNIESSGYNEKTFYNVANNGKIIVSGTLAGVNNLFNPYNGNQCNLDVDISGLSSYNDAGFNGNLQGMFGKGVRSLVIGSGFKVSSNGTNPSLLFIANNSGFTTLKVVSTTPPDVTSSGLYNWLQSFGTSCTNTNKKILVPPGTLSTYTSATGWSDYASIMEEYTE